MNRIEVYYTPQKGNVASCLRIYNDIKGYSCEAVGYNFIGRDADIMLELMKNVDYSKTKDCMAYGIYVDNIPYDEYMEVKNLLKLSSEEMENFYHRLDELDMLASEYIKLYKQYKKQGKDVNTIFEDYETKGLEEEN